jgi:arylformamidase
MRALYREFDSQAQIDAQYNPSLGLEPGDQPMLHFAARAAHTRTALRCILNVPYGPTLEETLDIFPAEVPNAPVFVFIHGGYWRALSSKDFSGVALGLHPLGITTVVINYALCPFVTIDEITRQTRAATAWVLRHIDQYGGDPTACVHRRAFRRRAFDRDVSANRMGPRLWPATGPAGRCRGVQRPL